MLWTGHIDHLVGNLKSRANLLYAIYLSRRRASYSCVSKLTGATITNKLDYGYISYIEATKKKNSGNLTHHLIKFSDEPYAA